MPLTLIDCGLPVPVLTTDTDPVRAPAAPGLNVMFTEQFSPELTVVHVQPVTANSDGLLLLTAGAVVVLVVWWIRTSLRRRAARRAEDETDVAGGTGPDDAPTTVGAGTGDQSSGAP